MQISLEIINNFSDFLNILSHSFGVLPHLMSPNSNNKWRTLPRFSHFLNVFYAYDMSMHREGIKDQVTCLFQRKEAKPSWEYQVLGMVSFLSNI